MPDKHSLTYLIKQKAFDLSFGHCGISPVGELTQEAKDLEKWLNQGRHGDMKWMENHFEKRVNPGKLMPGAKSIISLSLNYYPEKDDLSKGEYKISRYAYGRDYHKVLKKKMKALLQAIIDEVGDIEGRAFVDSAPVMDKAWAKRSGLGWVGKNTNLINQNTGSYFFLGEIILDLDLNYDNSVADRCGSCTRCLDACPTDALSAPYEIDGSKCISYLTIELKDKIPEEFKGKMEGWMYGCDICQEVCPWNRFSVKHNVNDFNPGEELMQMKETDWIDLTQDLFDQLFTGTAVRRTKYDGLRRNIRFIQMDDV